MSEISVTAYDRFGHLPACPWYSTKLLLPRSLSDINLSTTVNDLSEPLCRWLIPTSSLSRMSRAPWRLRTF
jgi:hypothetical protein